MITALASKDQLTRRSISEQSQSAMLDDGESSSSSSVVSSVASLPVVGSFGSFAECVLGELARSSIRSSSGFGDAFMVD